MTLKLCRNWHTSNPACPQHWSRRSVSHVYQQYYSTVAEALHVRCHTKTIL